ncbi:hypothetical protein [Marivita sp. GX14005]|uniref:hypothetical protein n=1 Tax=Marivita sp. GX14005 TaxID=2942276 RepID=UPI002018DBD1|nr:hypothetical protein [Marivita sp. GX14005]MCL3881832.1 hypothetical protein [Marivita sp. GX14005]
MRAKLETDEAILDEDFYHRLVAAGAFRWGLVIKLTIDAIAAARVAGSAKLLVDHFVDAWVAKTQENRVATPFTHSAFETMYRKDHPFIASLRE